METERTYGSKQDKGVSALIWCLSILLCVVFIACTVVGAGFFRISKLQSATAQDRPAQQSTPFPMVTPEMELPVPGASEPAPQVTVAPDVRESLPELELNVQDADQIIVMDDGKISALGNHEYLMENSDIYREVYDSQNKQGGEADE